MRETLRYLNVVACIIRFGVRKIHVQERAHFHKKPGFLKKPGFSFASHQAQEGQPMNSFPTSMKARMFSSGVPRHNSAMMAVAPSRMDWR